MSFDTKLGQSLLGKKILVGITYFDSDGDVESQQQLHGIVESVSETDGILISLDGVHEGKKWNMPPNTSSIVQADPGIYKLSVTNEEVEDPDFTCTWEVHSDKDYKNKD